MRFLQDGDPSQNVAVAQRAMSDIGAISARSRDLDSFVNILCLQSWRETL